MSYPRIEPLISVVQVTTLSTRQRRLHNVILSKSVTLVCLLFPITYLLNWSLQSFSHTPFILFVLILFRSDGTYSLISIPNDRVWYYNFILHSEYLLEVAVVWQVVCWLIRRKARVRVTDQTSKQNTKSISSALSSLSRLLVKTLSLNKIAMKSFSKICHSASTLNCRSRHLCIKLTHTT